MADEFEQKSMKLLSELLVNNALEADKLKIPTDEYYSMWMTILVIQLVAANRYTGLLEKDDLIKFVADVAEVVYAEEGSIASNLQRIIEESKQALKH